MQKFEAKSYDSCRTSDVTPMGPAFVGGDVASFVYEFDDVTAAGIASFSFIQSPLLFCYIILMLFKTGNMSTTIALTYPNSIPIMSRTSSEDGGLISCILLSVYRFFSTPAPPHPFPSLPSQILSLMHER